MSGQQAMLPFDKDLNCAKGKWHCASCGKDYVGSADNRYSTLSLRDTSVPVGTQGSMVYCFLGQSIDGPLGVQIEKTITILKVGCLAEYIYHGGVKVAIDVDVVSAALQDMARNTFLYFKDLPECKPMRAIDPQNTQCAPEVYQKNWGKQIFCATIDQSIAAIGQPFHALVIDEAKVHTLDLPSVQTILDFMLSFVDILDIEKRAKAKQIKEFGQATKDALKAAKERILRNRDNMDLFAIDRIEKLAENVKRRRSIDPLNFMKRANEVPNARI